MAEITKELGRIPVSRGNYQATTEYYKDNIVQYKRGSYQVVSESPIIGIPPTNDKNIVNPGWTLFAGTLDAQDVVNQIKEQEAQSIQAVADRETEILAKSDAANVSFDNTGTSLSGTNVQDALKETNGKINQLKNAGYFYAGIATPTTNPGTPDGHVFYIANGKGTYTNFGGINVTEDEVVVLYWDSAWHKIATGIASNDKLTELDWEINGYKIKKTSSDASHLVVSDGIIVEAKYSVDTLIFELPYIGDYLFDITSDVYVVFEEPKVGVSVNQDKVRITNGVPFTNTERKWLMLQFSKSETNYSVTCELDAKSIKSEIEKLKDEISNISTTSDKITDPESGQSVKSQIDNLNGEIYGQDAKEVLVMESVAGQSKQPNTLISGRKYRVVANVVATTWMTFGFAQNESQNWEDCLQVFRTNENGSLVFNAPNQETYPFVHMSGGTTINSFNVYEIVERKDGLEPIIKGFEGRINTIEDSIIVSDKKVFDTIKATSDYRVGDTISVVGGESLYYAQVKKDDDVNVDFSISSSYFRYGFTTELPANGVSVTGSNAVNSSYTNVKITAPFDGYFVCSAVTSALKNLLVYGNKDGIGKEVYNLYPLRGKTVVMLGDSISQLPNTGNVRGDGICEYFAKITGANVVRGAISGSHVSSRADVPTTIADDQDARTILDMVNIARGLANGDISKQVEAANWCVANNKGDEFWKVTIDNLALIDMNKVDIVTIFGGTNDFNSSVTIGDVTSTNDKEYCGAINNIVEVLMTAYPHLSIFVFTPIVRHFVDSSTTSTDADFSDNYIKGGNKLTDIRDAAIRSAEHNHVPSCNLYDGMGWNKWNFWKFFPTNDGTHPRYGYQHIARKMAQFVCANLNRL